jgi:ABC-2 type transport system ATP-binding protein
VTDTNALLIEGAQKTYGTGRIAREAVYDVSLHVAEGRVHGLLGPNGAGKTTTIKMLLGLVRPGTGRFEVFGDPATPAARQTIGFLPEQPYFPPHLTARQVMRLGGVLAGMSRSEIDPAATELLARVGLEGREGGRLSSFSRGMLQRLGLAQALLGEPRILVLDEPASGLDPVGQRDVRDIIISLRSQGTTVLLSSHQLSEVEAVCDDVTILNAGRVASRGRIDELLNVAGRTSLRVASDAEELPGNIINIAEDVSRVGSTWMLSVPDGQVRSVVDQLDDADWRIVALAPKRESLEDYFARLLAGDGGEVQ